MSDSLPSHEQEPTRILCPQDSPGKNTGVGCHFLFQRIFPTKGLNLGLLHCRRILYHLSHQGSPERQMLKYFWKHRFCRVVSFIKPLFHPDRIFRYFVSFHFFPLTDIKWHLWSEVKWALLVVQLVKNLHLVRETWFWSLGWEDPLEKGKATHSSILA